MHDHQAACLNGIGKNNIKEPSKDWTSQENLYLQQDKQEAVAVVGFSIRFPQDATSPEAFWQMLCEGRSAMTEIPKDRFNLDAFYHSDPSRVSSINFRGGHFIKGDLAAFDAPFFSVTPAEALSMDPQQRILLETTYRAFESGMLFIVLDLLLSA
ncbi:MAG: hypothetical protein Q9187_002405 [Circinaria calcarea]